MSKRLRGEVRTRRPRTPHHLTAKQIEKILESQRKHGVGPGARLDKPSDSDVPAIDGLMTSQASRTTPWDSVSRLGDWLQSFWHHEDAPTPAVKQSNLAIAHYQVNVQGLNLKDQAMTEEPYVHALEEFVGAGNVEVIDNPHNVIPVPPQCGGVGT